MRRIAGKRFSIASKARAMKVCPLKGRSVVAPRAYSAVCALRSIHLCGHLDTQKLRVCPYKIDWSQCVTRRGACAF